MAILSPINLKNWIEEHRHLLKPPVGNKSIYHDGFIVMIVGGPNSRKDYHLNQTPEFFYQIEGDIVLKIIDEGVARDVDIKEGEVFYLPANVPHSPQRKAETVGLVIEQDRASDMKDSLAWYCENCNHKLYEETFELENIDVDLKRIMREFYADEEKRTCDNCGAVIERPK